MASSTTSGRTSAPGARRSGAEQPRHEVAAEIAPAEAVDRDIYLHAAFGGPAQGAGDFLADPVVGEDIALEVDLNLGRFDFGEQRREVFAA